jgi:hypothetical protein
MIAPSSARSPAQATSKAPAYPHDESIHDESIPAELREYLQELEMWAQLNQRDLRGDTLAYWLLKVPAILASACSGILTASDVAILPGVLAALASACVLIDAFQPRGQLRNAHLRAIYDIRSLEHQIVSRWRVGSLRGVPDNKLAADILEESQQKQRKIEAELRAAETPIGQPNKE